MKVYKSRVLLDELQSDVKKLISEAVPLKSEIPDVLAKTPAPGKWNVLQVLEHLNSYGRYYLPAIKNSLEQDKPAVADFRPGLIGDYFTNLMLPNQYGAITRKLKAPKGYAPVPELDHEMVISTFLQQQSELVDVLEFAKSKDIGRIKTPISISRFIRLKVGDTFRFLIAHEQRHFLQLRNTLNTVKPLIQGEITTAQVTSAVS